MAYYQNQFYTPKSGTKQQKIFLSHQQQGYKASPTTPLTIYQVYQQIIVKKQIDDFVYSYQDVIGEGQFSKVYKGKQISTGNVVAIKVVEVQKINQPIFMTLLQNEIIILKSLNHKNLLQLKGVFSTSNNIYLITEFCNQGDLNEIIISKKVIPEHQALKILKHLLNGLILLQQQLLDIIHRDIKPANILLTDGIPKFADFGFAINKQLLQNQKDSVEGFKVGTPLYMAPETLFHNQYTFKTDIWALGCVYYEMLFGEVPFYSVVQTQLTEKILQYSHDNILHFPSGHQVSKESIALIKSMLEYDQGQRMNLIQITNLPILNSEFSSLKKAQKRGYAFGSGSSCQIKQNYKQIQENGNDTPNDSNLVNKSNQDGEQQNLQEMSPILKKFIQGSHHKGKEMKLYPASQSSLEKQQQYSPPLKQTKSSFIKTKSQSPLIQKKNSCEITKNCFLDLSFSANKVSVKANISTDSSVLSSNQKSRSHLTELSNSQIPLSHKDMRYDDSPGLMKVSLQMKNFPSTITRSSVKIHSRTVYTQLLLYYQLQHDRDATCFCQFLDNVMNMVAEDSIFQELDGYISSKANSRQEDVTQLVQLKLKLQFFAIKLQFMLLNKYGVVQFYLDQYEQKYDALILPEDLFQDQQFRQIYKSDLTINLEFFTTYLEYLKICILCFNKYLSLSLDQSVGQLPLVYQLDSNIQTQQQSIVRIDYIIITYQFILLFIENYDDFSAFCDQCDIERFVVLKAANNITMDHWNEIQTKIKSLSIL